MPVFNTLPKGPSHAKNSTESKFTTGKKRYGNSKTLRRVLRGASLSRQKRQENGTDKRARARVRAGVPACVRAYARARARVCARACERACVRASACVRACTRVRACARVCGVCACVCVRVCACACVRWPSPRMDRIAKNSAGAHYQSREEVGGLLGGLLKKGGGKPGISSTPQTFFGALNFIFDGLNGFESNSATYSDIP